MTTTKRTDEHGDDLSILERVTQALRSRGEEAALEHTGGGIYCIRLPIRGDRWMYWGTADAEWGCDIYEGEGHAGSEHLEGVLVSAANIDQAADSIIAFTNRLRA